MPHKHKNVKWIEVHNFRMSIDEFCMPNFIDDESENEVNDLFRNFDFCNESESIEQQIDHPVQKSDENHSFPIVPSFENILNSDFSINQKEDTKKVRPGRGCELPLSKSEADFKNRYYKTFLGDNEKKKFSKFFVVEIHKNIIGKELNLPAISRDQQRSINKYFRDFSAESEKILQYLYDKKDVILSKYPKLGNL